MGELHLEVSAERLRQENRLELERKQQKISYRETITKELENVEVWYKKKTGGSGHDARIWIDFEPNEGKGFKFFDKTTGQGMDKKKGEIEEVRKGLEEAMSSGLLLNYPLLDLKATLTRGQRHAVDTQPGDFKKAAEIALKGDGVEERKERIQKLGVTLLEPIMQVEIVVPKDYRGNILADLGSRRAVIE